MNDLIKMHKQIYKELQEISDKLNDLLSGDLKEYSLDELAKWQCIDDDTSIGFTLLQIVNKFAQITAKINQLVSDMIIEESNPKNPEEDEYDDLRILEEQSLRIKHNL